MILIDPFLLMTLHFSQIGLTDDLTFTGNPPSICEMCYAGPGQDPCITKACSFGRTDTRNQARTVYFIIDCTEMQADNDEKNIRLYAPELYIFTISGASVPGMPGVLIYLSR